MKTAQEITKEMFAQAEANQIAIHRQKMDRMRPIDFAAAPANGIMEKSRPAIKEFTKIEMGMDAFHTWAHSEDGMMWMQPVYGKTLSGGRWRHGLTGLEIIPSLNLGDWDVVSS